MSKVSLDPDHPLRRTSSLPRSSYSRRFTPSVPPFPSLQVPRPWCVVPLNVCAPISIEEHTCMREVQERQTPLYCSSNSCESGEQYKAAPRSRPTLQYAEFVDRFPHPVLFIQLGAPSCINATGCGKLDSRKDPVLLSPTRCPSMWLPSLSKLCNVPSYWLLLIGSSIRVYLGSTLEKLSGADP